MSNPGGNNPQGNNQAIPRDWTAFCAFIETNYRVIYTVALAHVRDAETAQEITQDVCVRLLLKRDRVPASANMSGWLARVARNTAIDWIRRRQTHSRILATMESFSHNPTAGNHSPQDARTAAIMEEEKQRLYKALEHIAPDDREMLLMHYLDGMEKQDIARLLEIHPSTVGRRIDKALLVLKKSMTEFEPTKLRSLRPAEHSSRGVLATLTTVAALSATQKAALAAVASPLPVLSVGGFGAAAGSSIATKAIKSAGSNFASLFSKWGVPVIVGGALLGVVAGVINRESFVRPVSSEKPSERRIPSTADRGTTLDKVVTSAAGRARSNTSGISMKRGLVQNSTRISYISSDTVDPKALSGTVKNEQGESIGDATVTVWVYVEGEYTSTTTTSNPTGCFVFEQLPEGYAYVTVDAQGYAHATFEEYAINLPWPTSLPLDIVLTRPVSLHGVVENEAGEPVGGATITVAQEFDLKQDEYQGQMFHDIFVTKSDGAGRFQFDSLKPGYVNLVTRHPDFADDLSEAIASNAKTARVKLGHGVSLVGSVFDGNTTVAHAEVIVNGDSMSKRQFGNAITTTDENGTYVATNLSIPGSGTNAWGYSITVNRDSGATVPLYLVELEKRKTTHTLVLNAQDTRATQSKGADRLWVNLRGNSARMFSESSPRGTAKLSGKLTLPEGVSTASITVSITDNKDYFKSVVAENLTFKFEQVVAGELAISAKTDPENLSSFVPQQITVREGDSHTIDLQCGTGTVKGSVLNREPGQRYYLTAYTVDPLSPLFRAGRGVVGGTFTESDGSFMFHGMLPGEYFMEVTGATEILSQPFHCRPGVSTILEITLPDTIELTGSLVDSLKGKSIPDAKILITSGHWNSTGGTNAFEVTTDKGGEFKCRLTTGYYKAILRDPHKMFDFNVTTGSIRIPPFDMRSYNGQIIVKNVGAGSERGAGKLDVELVTVQEGANQVSKILNMRGVSLGNDVVVLKDVKPGRYGLIVKSGFLVKDGERITTVFVPEVEVTEDKAAVIEVEVDIAAQVELICQPGKYMAYWENPSFWVKDGSGSGAKMPVSITNQFSTKLGLAPGVYEFGLTMDSGKEQSVTFEVVPAEKEKEVVLRVL